MTAGRPAGTRPARKLTQSPRGRLQGPPSVGAMPLPCPPIAASAIGRAHPETRFVVFPCLRLRKPLLQETPNDIRHLEPLLTALTLHTAMKRKRDVDGQTLHRLLWYLFRWSLRLLRRPHRLFSRFGRYRLRLDWCNLGLRRLPLKPPVDRFGSRASRWCRNRIRRGRSTSYRHFFAHRPRISVANASISSAAADFSSTSKTVFPWAALSANATLWQTSDFSTGFP